MSCQHLNFQAHADVIRLEDIGEFCIELEVRCVECKVRFEFIGVRDGLSRAKPMRSPDGFQLRAPIRPNGHGTSMLAGTEFGFSGDQPPEVRQPGARHDGSCPPSQPSPYSSP